MSNYFERFCLLVRQYASRATILAIMWNQRKSRNNNSTFREIKGTGMSKLKMHTSNLNQNNIGKIREIFPSCVTEAHDEVTGRLCIRVDFDRLSQELSDHVVEGSQERYRIDWPGKRKSLVLANAPTTKTLRPIPDESLHFDTTKNLFVEGENLDALKLLY